MYCVFNSYFSLTSPKKKCFFFLYYCAVLGFCEIELSVSCRQHVICVRIKIASIKFALEITASHYFSSAIRRVFNLFGFFCFLFSFLPLLPCCSSSFTWVFIVYAVRDRLTFEWKSRQVTGSGALSVQCLCVFLLSATRPTVGPVVPKQTNWIWYSFMQFLPNPKYSVWFSYQLFPVLFVIEKHWKMLKKQ